MNKEQIIEKLNDLSYRYNLQHHHGYCHKSLACEFCIFQTLYITEQLVYYPHGYYDNRLEAHFTLEVKSKNWLARLFDFNDYQVFKVYEALDNVDLLQIIERHLPEIEKFVKGLEEKDLQEKRECLDRATEELRKINATLSQKI